VTSASVLASSATASAVKNFTAVAGEQRLVLIGQPNAPALVGSAGVRIEDPVSGAVLLDTVKTFTTPAAPAASPATFEHELSVAAAGTYTLQTTDFALPQALADLRTTVVRHGDPTTILANVTGPAEITLVAAGPDTFDVFVYAELASSVPHGLVGVNLRDAVTGAAQFSELHELGAWPYQFPFDVSAATGLTIAVNDLGFPLPLAAVGAVLVHDGRLALPAVVGSGSSAAPVDAGKYTAYVDAAAASGAAFGSFGVLVTNAVAARLVETVQNVVPTAAPDDAGTIDASFDVTAAGDYTLTLTDFGAAGFFDAFTSISLALARDNAIVKTLNAPGSVTISAAPGHYSVAVLADPAGASGQGLLGVAVHGGPGDATIFEKTDAVGSGFRSATVDITSAQSVDVTLADLAFPAAFGAIKVAVTRGSARAGEIIGAGTFSFAATPGKYFVNLLATPSAAVGYGTLGLDVRATPPVPGVVLAATPVTVVTGRSVTLTWSSTDATTCVASGGWSGARPLAGAETIAAVNANTSFKLACTGPGGGKEATVAVTVTAAPSSGGGGGMDWVLLALLGLSAAAARSARRAELRRV
jgi:hypothetical protein